MLSISFAGEGTLKGLTFADQLCLHLRDLQAQNVMRHQSMASSCSVNELDKNVKLTAIWMASEALCLSRSVLARMADPGGAPSLAHFFPAHALLLLCVISRRG